MTILMVTTRMQDKKPALWFRDFYQEIHNVER